MNKEDFNKLSLVRQKAEMMSFCNKQGIFIYLEVLTNTTAHIFVENKKGFDRCGKKVYNISKRIKEKEEKWWKAIEDGYKFYYEQILNKKE